MASDISGTLSDIPSSRRHSGYSPMHPRYSLKKPAVFSDIPSEAAFLIFYFISPSDSEADISYCNVWFRFHRQKSDIFTEHYLGILGAHSDLSDLWNKVFFK